MPLPADDGSQHGTGLQTSRTIPPLRPFDDRTRRGSSTDSQAVRHPWGRAGIRRLMMFAAAVSLAGCFSAFPKAEGRHSSAAAPVHAGAGEYVVIGGDTLFSIAFRNQLDFHDLAAWNRIAGPEYRIYPGRLLRLTPPGSSAAGAARRNPADNSVALRTPAAAGNAASPANGSGLSGAAPPEAAGIAAVSAPQNQANVRLPPDSAPPPRLPKPAPASLAAAGPHFDAGRWRWPTAGLVARGFGAEGSKGIDIAGALGQAVTAAGPGKVVYSGSALKGYGELVIIQHDEQYLSAYGFNQRRLVNEGDVVAAGQPIAELGFGPEQKPELHFEIRDRGRPVDPQSLLPRR